MSEDGDYITRMGDELAELRAKLRKLTDFLYTERFHSLPSVEQDQLTTQCSHMMKYERVLDMRYGPHSRERRK